MNWTHQLKNIPEFIKDGGIMFIHKGEMKNSRYYSMNYLLKDKKHMWAISWSLNGEWWYHKDPSTAKFLWWNIEKGKKEFFIGKFAFCFRRQI